MKIVKGLVLIVALLVVCPLSFASADTFCGYYCTSLPPTGMPACLIADDPTSACSMPSSASGCASMGNSPSCGGTGNCGFGGKFCPYKKSTH